MSGDGLDIEGRINRAFRLCHFTNHITCTDDVPRGISGRQESRWIAGHLNIPGPEKERTPESPSFLDTCPTFALCSASSSHFYKFCGGREERTNYPRRVGGELRRSSVFIGFGVMSHALNTPSAPSPPGARGRGSMTVPVTRKRESQSGTSGGEFLLNLGSPLIN